MSKPTANPPSVIVPPESDLGPAMLALTPNQRAFVVALLQTGAQNNTQAAAMAGYGGTENSQRVAAHHLAHNPKVQAAIKEEADKRLRAGAILASSALIEIVSNTHHKDRFKAAVELLNRSGLVVATQHEVTVTRKTDQEVIDRIVELAKNMGMDPAALLGQYGYKMPAAERTEAIEAEYEEVDDDWTV